jgi:hypothetical protein
VAYESRLELTRLLLADFDPAVAAIAAQPFLLRAHADGRVRRHVPDFFLVRADESALLVNVKPAARLADPQVASALEWPGRLAREHGWDYEVWSGADPVFLANVRTPCSASTASWNRSRPRSASSPATSTSTAPQSSTTPAGVG